MPITTNLMVTDMARSLAFWRGLLGFEVKMAVPTTAATTRDASGPTAIPIV